MSEESRLIFISKDQKRVKEYRISRTKLVTYISIFLILISVAGKFGFDLLIDMSNNSKIARLERTNGILQTRLAEMKSQVIELNTSITQIVQKDDELRIALGLDPISEETREVGIGGARYDFTKTDEVSGFDEGQILGQQLTELARLDREVNLEFKSYHDLMTTFQTKQDSLAHLPALRPIIGGYVTSKFGSRFHPLYKIKRHHDGIDIGARRGTPIYATADGVVKFAGRNGGYGNLVMLDHKYGYQTRYGHMNRILVRRGQKIKRGDKIGEVGSTGVSTAPHLHYEVRIHNKPVDPSTYFFNDMSLNKQIVSKNQLNQNRR